MRKPHLIVMEALEVGLEVQLGQHVWVMAEGTDTHGNKGPMLCVKMRNETTGEPHYVNPDLTVNAFMRLCAALSEAELFKLSADVCMNRTYGRKPL